eukprot:TRINITY_DN2834_c0_g1_i1.p1 TRINITY_DN2834_c0_g1~~TRINITY_DN2834_c0_g1_i1.p1  ORF type:complete len:142 (+),score=33.29 TRINITY_DN2834_c0_g1_i1:64-489(+)
MTYSGRVVRWYDHKGFGFIKCDEFENDLYCHFTGFGGGNLIEGRSVTFDLEDDERAGKKRCTNVSGEAVDAERRAPRRDSRDRDRDRGDRRRRDDSRDRNYGRRDSRDRGYDRRDSRDRGYDRRDRRERDRSYDSRDRKRY